MAYVVKLPLKKDIEYGFEHLKDLNAVIFQQLKMLLLTDKYEKIDDPDYGCGLYRYVLEYDSSEYRNNIRVLVSDQIKKYMPYISLVDFIFNKSGDILHLTIQYYVGSLENIENLTIPINSVNI